jgi:uncharacterized membrane protein (DUF4010 family)
MPESLLAKLGLALAIGLVVGLERGWRQRERTAGGRVAGLRTYGLAGLLGGVCGALSDALGSPVPLGLGLLAFATVFAWFEAREKDSQDKQDFSVTAVVAAILVFALGGLAIVGDAVAAAAGGVAVAVVLASREVLHSFLRTLTWPEVRSALLLLAMTVIVLPLLPNRTIDPWGGINPWEIWLFTVMVAVISFAGYVAVRILGPAKGIVVSGVIGAVVSSTAVTLAFSRRARNEKPVRAFAGGAALAAMVSATRVVAIVLLVKANVAAVIAAPALAGAVAFGLVGWWLLARVAPVDATETKLGNPLDVAPLAIFAVTFAVIAGVSAAASTYLGASSIILTSGLSGLFDADAASLSAARLAGDAVSATIAGQAILLAIAMNALTRVGIAAAIGPREFWVPLAIATGSAIAVGGAVAIVTGAI